MRLVNTSVLGLVASLALATSVQAVTIDTVPAPVWSAGSDTIVSTTTPWTGKTFSYKKFNTALGTLTGIQFDVSTTISASLNVVNISGWVGAAAPSGGNAYGVANMAVNVNASGDPSLFNCQSVTDSLTFSLARTGDTASGTRTAPGTGTIIQHFGMVDPAILALFEGTGTEEIDLGASAASTGLLSYTGGAVFQSNPVVETGAKLDVTYSYVAVPEPTTLGLIGLTGLVLLRRKPE